MLSGDVAIHACANSYEGQTLAVEEEDYLPSGAVTITLRLGGYLAGRVVFEDGESAGAGIRVLALSGKKREIAFPRESYSLGGDPTVLETCTLVDGSFSIESVSEDIEYTIVAGGIGVCSIEPIRGVSPSKLDLEVTVAPLYAFAVRVVEEGGRPLQVSAFLPRVSWVSVSDESSIEELSRSDMRIALAGVDAADIPDSGGLMVSRFFLSRGMARPEKLGPVELFVDVPGYQSTMTEVWARRVLERITYGEIELERYVDGFGTVLISLLGHQESSSSLRGRSSRRPIGLLDFHDTQNPGVSSFQVTLREDAGDQIELEGFPFGVYWAYFQAFGCSYRYPSEGELRVVVGPSIEKIDLDLTWYSSLEWMGDDQEQVGAADGSPIRLTLIANGGSGIVGTFSGPPYRLSYLAPGDYDVSIDRWELDHWSSVGRFPRVRLTSGEASEVGF
jgi:hypothetical protein